MKPIGPLMWEHRLIEKMLQVVVKEAELNIMLREFQEFDRKMIHEKYERLVESFTGEKAFKAGRAL